MQHSPFWYLPKGAMCAQDPFGGSDPCFSSYRFGFSCNSLSQNHVGHELFGCSDTHCTGGTFGARQGSSRDGEVLK